MPPVDEVDVEVVEETPKAPKPAKVSQGPKKGERGEFLPATYKTPRGNTRTDC